MIGCKCPCEKVIRLLSQRNSGIERLFRNQQITASNPISGSNCSNTVCYVEMELPDQSAPFLLDNGEGNPQRIIGVSALEILVPNQLKETFCHQIVSILVPVTIHLEVGLLGSVIVHI